MAPSPSSANLPFHPPRPGVSYRATQTCALTCTAYAVATASAAEMVMPSLHSGLGSDPLLGEASQPAFLVYFQVPTTGKQTFLYCLPPIQNSRADGK